MGEIVKLENVFEQKTEYPKLVGFALLRDTFTYGLLIICRRFRHNLHLSGKLYEKIIEKFETLRKLGKLKKDQEWILNFFGCLRSGEKGEIPICYGLVDMLKCVLFDKPDMDDIRVIDDLSRELMVFIELDDEVISRSVIDIKAPQCRIIIRIKYQNSNYNFLFHREELKVDSSPNPLINLFRFPFVSFIDNEKSKSRDLHKSPIITNPPETIIEKKKPNNLISQDRCKSCFSFAQNSTISCINNCIICNLCRTLNFDNCLLCLHAYTKLEKRALYIVELNNIKKDDNYELNN